MACCGIDPHGSVGGVVECRCLFSPSMPANYSQVRWRAQTVVHCCMSSITTFRSVIRAPLLEAHDLQRHDWLATQLNYNSLTSQSPTATATATRGVDDMPVLC
jgi:hypothetical protein